MLYYNIFAVSESIDVNKIKRQILVRSGLFVTISIFR